MKVIYNAKKLDILLIIIFTVFDNIINSIRNFSFKYICLAT